MSRDEALEAEIQANGLTEPRVRPQDVDAAIAHVEFVKHVSKSGQVLRWCVMTLQNGYSVAGKPSCSASSANDNAFIGEKVAEANAREEIWPLLGYVLKDKLHAIATALPPPVDNRFVAPGCEQFTPHPLHANVIPDRSLD